MGLVYPLVVWGIGAVLFPKQAAGSLLTNSSGTVIGSSLDRPVLHRRQVLPPSSSAAGAGYDAMSSSASNLGPTSKALVDMVKARVATETLENPGLSAGNVPVDMVTASGSGLDPDISPDNAAAQVARVAKAAACQTMPSGSSSHSHTRGRDLGFLGNRGSMCWS